jgi:hypothetical protein
MAEVTVRVFVADVVPVCVHPAGSTSAAAAEAEVHRYHEYLYVYVAVGVHVPVLTEIDCAVGVFTRGAITPPMETPVAVGTVMTGALTGVGGSPAIGRTNPATRTGVDSGDGVELGTVVSLGVRVGDGVTTDVGDGAGVAIVGSLVGVATGVAEVVAEGFCVTDSDAATGNETPS